MPIGCCRIGCLSRRKSAPQFSLVLVPVAKQSLVGGGDRSEFGPPLTSNVASDCVAAAIHCRQVCCGGPVVRQMRNYVSTVRRLASSLVAGMGAAVPLCAIKHPNMRALISEARDQAMQLEYRLNRATAMSDGAISESFAMEPLMGEDLPYLSARSLPVKFPVHRLSCRR